MIDTFNLILFKEYYDRNQIEEVFRNKMQFKADAIYSNGTALIFNYKNYCFKLTQHHLIAVGSLTKLYYGDNMQNLNFCQVQEALMEFESLFGIPFDKAVVNRVDIAASMIMSQTSKLYIDILQTPSGFEPHIHRTTKTFDHHAKAICVYDKVEQLRKAKNQRAVYNQFKNNNILKYEFRCSRQLLSKLAEGEITFDRFYSPEFYKTLLEQWYDGYKAIPKLTNPYTSELNYNSLTAFKESLIKIGINQVGGIEVLTSGLKQIKMPKFVRAAIKKYLESLPKSEPLSPVLQKELDEKIDLIYENAILELQGAA